jgi:GNAT superfamily N-acetyltransferase
MEVTCGRAAALKCPRSTAVPRLRPLGSVVPEAGACGAFPGRIVGTVQLGLALPPNQPHRADVKKLLVHRSARGRGIGMALMTAAEEAARARGRTLLVLDTALGDDAERLYARAGWNRVGVIPGDALFPDGSPCDTVVFWKNL